MDIATSSATVTSGIIDLVKIDPIIFATLIGLINATTQFVKMLDTKNGLVKFYPLIAMIQAFIFGTIGFHLNWLVSFVAGLSAVGVYSGVKKTINP